MNYYRYIPPVDVAPYATYVGKRFTRPPNSQVQDPMATNPACPTSLCSVTSGVGCKCNMNHYYNPRVKRFFRYKFNLY